MKSLLIILVLISTSTFAGAQQSRAPQPRLTRSQIKEAERRLADLGYWTGAVDGLLNPATRSAIVAFQKWEGRTITGKLTSDELDAIRNSAAPKARETGYEHVEVDVDRQVLLLVDGNDGIRVLPISTGSGKEFLEEGEPSIAYTPRGRFLVYEKVNGWDGPVGSMYYSNYISGGVAIHGFPSVPRTPGSHGCVRVPIFAAREVSQRLPVGTIVLVYDKVSFVSGKPWVENPKLKEAALLASMSAGFDDYNYPTNPANKTKAFVIKKVRPRITRAD
ncbi:MAG TPA: L,D-transpeptidase family protein [Pyrinomonadaceae bacterium]|nr:L,D-transpeptidase family protein [Pyrinomonadaceae bacterium]